MGASPAYIVGLALVLASAHANAQSPPSLHAALGGAENLKLGGSFRARLELIDGQFRPNTATSDQLLALRTTLAAEYDTGDLRIGAEIMDSRGYFQESDSVVGTSEVNAFELVQAYAAFDTGNAESRVTLKIGRLTRDVGSRRLIARAAFRNTTNAFTGATFDWRRPGGGSLLAFWLLPHTRLPADRALVEENGVEFDRESTDLQFFGATYTARNVAGGSFELYGYGLLERDDPRFPTRNRRLFTPGVRWLLPPSPGKFDAELEAIYQTGETRASASAADTADLDVTAFFVHAELGRSFEGGWQPRLALQYDHASGDDRDAGSFKRFDTLFGARRFEYGPTGIYGPVGRANLIAAGGRVEVKPSSLVDGLVAYRALWLDSRTDSFSSTGVRDSAGNSGRFAGHQVEARVRYWLIPKTLRLDTGGAVLLKGRFLDSAPNAPDTGDTTYGYSELSFNF